MRHTRIQQAKPERSFAERIVAVIVAIAMLGGMGYATTSAAMAEDTPATVETTTDQSATTANESTDGKNAADGTDADNAGDAATGTADTESDTNTGADAGVNTANAANAGDAASSDANSQTDTTAQSNPQPVNAEQNSPSVVADDTDSDCIYAGKNALQRVCWLDMSKFDSETAKEDAGQKMTVNLGGGLTMSFIARYSGKRTVVASGVPTWDNRKYPGQVGHHAIFGVEGYSDFPAGSKPALYQNDGYRKGSEIQLSDITITKDGQNVANLQYSFVMADAESTNQNEQMVYTSSSKITQLGSYPTDGSKYGFCEQRFSDDRKNITCTGTDEDSVPQGIRLYTTSTPTRVSIEMKNSGPGSRQGAAFGVIFSQAVAKITVNGLASGDANTTFKASVSNNETGSLESGSIPSNSIPSNTAESGTLPILASAGVSKTVRFYLDGSPSDWSKYDVTFEGTDNGKVVSSPTIQTDESGRRRYVDMTVAADHTVQGHFTVTAKPDPLGVPEHHKTIAKKKDDTYTLNLNVTGKRSSTSQTVSQPVDIALVLDVSGSMRDPMDKTMDKTTKLDALKRAAKEFLTSTAKENAAIADNDNEIKVSLVKFASEKKKEVGNDTYPVGFGPFADTYNYTQIVNNLTGDMSTLSESVDALQAGGATQADYGLEKANAALADDRANVKKVVVFFTDGEPNSSSGFDGDVANAAVKNAKNLKNSGTTIYSVGVFSKANPSDTSGDFNAYMNAVSSNYPNATTYRKLGARVDGGNYYMIASNSEGLSKVFEDIQQTITTTNGYTGVTIQDTLSDYAEFADDPTKTAKVVDSNGDIVTAQWNIKVKGKTITASPKSTEPLPDGVTYTLQFDIKPTQTAYDEYAANLNASEDGYKGVKGDAGTDLLGNNTSSNQPGFHSNGFACLAYSADGVDHKCEENLYLHPVIQVVSSTLHIEKKWSGEGSKPKSITVDIKQGDDTYKRVTLEPDTDGNWSTDVIIPAGAAKTYTVTETEPENHQWKASYQYKVGDSDFVDGNTVTVPKSTTSQTATVRITNKQALVTLPANSVFVTKQVVGSTTARDFSFTMVATGNNAENVTWPKQGQTSSKVTIESVTSAEEKTASFSDKLTFPARDATYTFQVTEDKPQKHIGWKYDDSTKTVRVTVKYDERQGKWIATANPANVTFTNHYIAVSALPLTGGMTDRQWLFVGGVVGGLAVLLIGAAGVWNGKKRLV